MSADRAGRPPEPDPGVVGSDVLTCVQAAEHLFATQCQRLAGGARRLVRRMPAQDGPRPHPDRVVDLVRPLAAVLLDDRRLLGAGFVANPEAFDGTRLLAWWQGDPRALVSEPLALGRAADYVTKEWFTVPMRTGAFHVTGPYIDYVCSDEFVVTLTLPVVDDRGRALGLMGLDLLAETVEEALAPPFVAARAMLLNPYDQVVVPGRSRVFAGDRVDREDFPLHLACRDLPMTVVAGTR